jgi:hypothetical protein
MYAEYANTVVLGEGMPEYQIPPTIIAAEIAQAGAVSSVFEKIFVLKQHRRPQGTRTIYNLVFSGRR